MVPGFKQANRLVTGVLVPRLFRYLCVLSGQYYKCVSVLFAPAPGDAPGGRGPTAAQADPQAQAKTV